MKKILSLLLALMLLVSLTACAELTDALVTLPEQIKTTGSFESTEPETRPTESTEPESVPTESTEPETRPAESTEPETRPTESTEPETRPTESTTPTTKPTESTKPATKPTESTKPVTEPTEATEPETTPPEDEYILDPDGSYTSKEDVALYIHLYGELPNNFITKSEARSLGWKSGSLEPYAPGKCIGGDRFGNYEGLLPKAAGRTYTECDIDTLGAKSRGAKRIVFSNDGLVYYTDDHYESFTLLYSEEENYGDLH